jgi:glycosyltransferase involved in cell wall biosynthesis
MRILTVSGLYAPYILGGAEASAVNLDGWLAHQGHEIHVLASALSATEECLGKPENGITMWRRYFPRPYPVYEFPQAPGWKKPQWHLQDMFDPRNRRPVSEVLDAVMPDVALVHLIQGLGFNTLRELARRGIPVVIYLHDLGLACVKMSMFKDGKNCTRQCVTCKITSRYKRDVLDDFERIGFCSPSRANLEHLQRHFPLEPRPCAVIPNANKYPEPSVARVPSERIRLLYVGRLNPQKGVDLILEVLDELSAHFDFSLRVVGGGQSEAQLRSRYEGRSWCSFTGHTPQETVSNEMLNADALLLPSIWLENSPGVAIQALGLGLPVIGSDRGGIPEIVTSDENGLLLPPGDKSAWSAALRRLFEAPAALDRWRSHAARDAERFEQDALGNRHLAFIEQVAHGQRSAHG